MKTSLKTLILFILSISAFSQETREINAPLKIIGKLEVTDSIKASEIKLVNGLPDQYMMADGSLSESINTAFVEKTYSSTLSITHNPKQPNFFINLGGNLDLTLTNTTNGDSGLVNIYFTLNEEVILNGMTDLVVVGNANMITVYFIHNSDGLKWYRNDVGLIDVSNFADQDGTILYHNKVGYIGTGNITNVGNIITINTPTFINRDFVGAKIIKGNGEKAIISGFTDLDVITTSTPFNTNSTDTFTIYAKSIEIDTLGNITQYNYQNIPQIKLDDVNGKYSIYRFETSGNGITNLSGVITTFGEAGSTRFLDGALYIDPSRNIYSGDNPNLPDIGLTKNSTGTWEINNGTAGVFADLKLKSLDSSSYSTLGTFTVATLPIPTKPTAYATVTDATAPTYMGALIGGGSVVCPVFYNGTVWVSH